MSAFDLPEAVNIPITFDDAEELPIMLANAFAVQSSPDGVFILTIAQAVPPIFAGDEAEQKRQLANVKSVPGKTIARIAVTPSKLRELVTSLAWAIEQYDAMQKGGRDGNPTGDAEIRRPPSNNVTGGGSRLQ